MMRVYDHPFSPYGQKVKIAGTRNRDSTVEDTRPPTTASARG